MKKEHPDDKKKKTGARGGAADTKGAPHNEEETPLPAPSAEAGGGLGPDAPADKDAPAAARDAAPAGPDSAAPGPATEGQDALEALERTKKEKEELHDTYIRLLADFDNYKKRMTREKADLIRFANESLLRDFLPVIDNIERLKAHSSSEGDWDALLKGIELILQDIKKLLAKYDVHPIEAVGKPFDPTQHEAIQKVETTQSPPHTVIEEYQKGYTFRGRLLRPSAVCVAVQPAGADVAGQIRWQVGDEPEQGSGGEGPSIN